MSELHLGRRYFAAGKKSVSLSDAQKEAKNAVKKLIEDGTYEFESVPCLCDASVKNDLLLATVDRYGLGHRTVICQTCGLIRTNPRLSQASYNHFYENWYRQLYSGWSHVDESGFRNEFEGRLSRGERIVEILQSNRIDLAGSIVLDIGCGGGWTLPAFARCGAKTIGFDYGKYIKFGKELYGLDLRYGGIEEAIEQGIKADIVILSHVVEHFTDPIRELRRLKNLLVANSICYIETPGVLNTNNHYMALMGMLQNAHTYTFSRVTLSNLAKMCGYKVECCDEFIHMLYRPSAIELDDIGIEAQHAGLVIQYLRDCERKHIPRYLVKRCRLFVRHVGGATLRILGVYPLARRLYHKILGIPGKCLT